MRLISCDNCGVVSDDRIHWPYMYDDEGEFRDSTGAWDGDTYRPIIKCPVCESEIMQEEAE